MTVPDRRSRTRGCLLAGAVGDALGAPVEFDALPAIRAAHGPAGVTGLLPSGYGPPGLVTDDTQMVLFTVEALLEGGEPGPALHAAYLRWLHTQDAAAPPSGATGLAAQPWLYAARAPGNACLSGLRSGRRGTTDAPANPGSKGCGTVMRSAPFGLDPRLGTPEAVAAAALAGSVLTHGHPTAGAAAVGLAVLVHHLVGGADLPEAVRRTLDHLRTLDGHAETTAALEAAVRAAADGPPSAERLTALGEGWVAEEALGMSVYCALAHPGRDALRAALLLAVNHGGDSDSTGAITGNVLGALHGEEAVPADWAQAVEGRETLLDLADRLAGRAAAPGRPATVVLTSVPADPERVAVLGRLSRIRGLLLGLAVGDALSRPQPVPDVLLAGVTTQLACFTTEGLIRAMVRYAHRGIGPSPAVVWFALRRWAAIQGIPTAEPVGPSGWLDRVPALGRRRGDAPATVDALTAATGSLPGPAPATARGHHALTRVLPLGGVEVADGWTADVVRSTHGHESAVRAALCGVGIARRLVHGDPLDEAVAAAGPAALPDGPDDHSAEAALRGGVTLARACPGPDALAATLAAAPGPGAAVVAGALLGARHGVEALPVGLVGRLELAWVADTLARDLAAQRDERPGGADYAEPADPHWHHRYPGG